VARPEERRAWFSRKTTPIAALWDVPPCKAAGLTNLRPHDPRRSLGPWQAIAGSSLQIIGASLGHGDHKSTQVYSRLLMDPVRVSVSGAVQAMLTAGEQPAEKPKTRTPREAR